MTNKHTPGPWLLQDRTVYSLEHAAWRKGEELFTNRFYAGVQRGPTISDEELEANVRLIAAAPDLLEAAQRYIGALDAWDGSAKADRYTTRCEYSLREAIAKAKGETK